MRKFTVQVVLLLIVIIVGLYTFKAGSTGNLSLPLLPQRAKFADLQINNQVIKAELADTSARRSKGLGGRSSLAENEGMLFIFPKADKHPFWMKGLSFPLDFVWILEDRVVDILENIQPPPKNTPDSSLPIYSANMPIDKVLELKAGSVQRLNIKIGDIIRIAPS